MKIAKNLKPAVLSAVIAGAVLFSGCGSEYNEDTKYDVNSMSAAAYDVSEAEYAVDADVNTNVNTKMVQLDAVEETEENEPTMRHYSVSLSIETLDFDKTMSDLSETLNKYQANIINSSEYDSNNNWYVSSMRTPEEGVRNASISARVPSESFESALNDMENISGKVISKNISSVDNTRRYNGNNDRLEALKAEKENMQRLMDETKEAEALVAFYQRLTDINTEIAMYETDNNDIIYDSDFCEFYIDVKTVQNYTEKVAVNASFGEKLSSAFKDGRDGFVEGIQNIILTFVSNWFMIIFAGIVVFAFVLICRKIKKNRKNIVRVNKQSNILNNKQVTENTVGQADEDNIEKEKQ